VGLPALRRFSAASVIVDFVTAVAPARPLLLLENVTRGLRRLRQQRQTSSRVMDVGRTDGGISALMRPAFDMSLMGGSS